MNWFIEKKISTTSLRTIQQLSPLRDKTKRDHAVELLIEHNRIRIVKSGSKTKVEVNPRAMKTQVVRMCIIFKRSTKRLIRFKLTQLN
jgi:hypothetical protein